MDDCPRGFCPACNPDVYQQPIQQTGLNQKSSKTGVPH